MNKSWSGKGLMEHDVKAFKARARRSIRKQHTWFYYKGDQFRSCRDCGAVERSDRKAVPCPGRAPIGLRGKLKS